MRRSTWCLNQTTSPGRTTMAFNLMEHLDTSPTGSVRVQTHSGGFRTVCVALTSLSICYRRSRWLTFKLFGFFLFFSLCLPEQRPGFRCGAHCCWGPWKYVLFPEHPESQPVPHLTFRGQRCQWDVVSSIPNGASQPVCRRAVGLGVFGVPR